MGQSAKPFKTRAKEIFIECAEIYKSVMMDYEYLICSKAFIDKPYYIFYATKDNYLHLTGVNSKLKPSAFFEKCINHTLTEDDFDFSKQNQSESEVKGCVRRKIRVLPFIGDILKAGVLVEEQFSKGRIVCSFATATGLLTLGFIAPGRARPKTILEGNHLKHPEDVDLILRKPSKSSVFTEIVLGDEAMVLRHLNDIIDLVSDDILPSTVPFPSTALAGLTRTVSSS